MSAARCTIHGADGRRCNEDGACDFYWADEDTYTGREYDQACDDDADAMAGWDRC